MSVCSPIPAPRPSAPTLTALHRRLARRMSRLRRYACPSHSHEDLESEATLVILQVLQSDPADDERALQKVVNNRLSSLARRDRRRAGRCRSLADIDTPDTREPAETGIDELLELHGERLTAQQRVVLQMTSQGRPDLQIALALATNEGTVRSARCQAIARLREIVADD